MSDPDGGTEVLVEPTWVYWLGRFLVASYLHLFHRFRVEGAERIPAQGGAMIIANHCSYLDIPVVAASTRRHVCFVARDSLARSRFLRFVMEGSRVVLIRRGAADRTALRAMAVHLSAADLVAVYPEGTRSSDGRLGEFRPGALLAARLAGVVLVPAAIRGTDVALGRHARMPRLFAPVAVRFGEAIDSALPDALERVRAAVQGMLAEGGAVPREPR